MLWIVQNNLFNEDGYVAFINALDRLNIEYLVVKPIPFSSRLVSHDFDSFTQNVDDVPEPIIDETKKIIVFGATTLVRIAKERNWNPGAYLNENFDFRIWRDRFGPENVLNSDAITGTIGSLSPTVKYDHVFVRPVHDTKSFSGTVMSKYDFQDWLLQMSMIEEEDFVPLHKNTEILIAESKEIYSEARMFVVDGKVVTASMYKRGNQVLHDANVDPRILTFAQDMVHRWLDIQMMDRWQPAKAFVLDIADTNLGLKVLEINNINSAGFYKADVMKLITAIHNMEARVQ